MTNSRFSMFLSGVCSGVGITCFVEGGHPFAAMIMVIAGYTCLMVLVDRSPSTGDDGKMATFRLIETTQVKCGTAKTEDCYLYRDDTGRTVQFHAHPDRAFTYVIVQGDRTLADAVIESFVYQGLQQNTYAGGFNEAISALNVSI